MNRLADGRAGIRLAGFYGDAHEVRGPVANFSQNLVGFAALVPVDVVQCERADMVGRGIITPGTHLDVEILDLGHAENTVFDLADQFVHFVDGEIAACTNIDHAERHLDFGEVLDATAEYEKCGIYGQQQSRDGRHVAPGPLQRSS